MEDGAPDNLAGFNSPGGLNMAAVGAAPPQTSPGRPASPCGNRGRGGSVNESPRADPVAAAPKRPRAPDAPPACEPPQQRHRASQVAASPAEAFPPSAASAGSGRRAAADRTAGGPNGADPFTTDSGSSGSSSSRAPMTGDPRARSPSRPAGAAAATATSKARGAHLVIVWDLCDVLSPLRALLRAGAGAAGAAGGSSGGSEAGAARARALLRLGVRWRRAVLAVGDGLLGLAQLEDLDVCHISDVRAPASVAAAGATAAAAPGTASGSPIKRAGSSPLPACDPGGWPEITVQPAGKRPSAAGVRRAFEAAAAAYTDAAASGAALAGSAGGDAAAQLPQLRGETDTLCGGWLARTRATLAALGANPTDAAGAAKAAVLPRRVTHFVVSRGQLVEAMAELLALGLAPAFGPEQVYSASGATRLHCFSRINALRGPGTCFAAIGGGVEARGAAEQLGWSYVPAAPSGIISPQNEAAAAAELRAVATVQAPLPRVGSA